MEKPYIVERLFNRMIWGAGLFGILAGIFYKVCSRLNFTRGLEVGASPWWALIPVSVLVAGTVRSWQLWWRVRRTGFLRCPTRCGYDLRGQVRVTNGASGLEEDTRRIRCPECGTERSIGELRATWQQSWEPPGYFVFQLLKALFDLVVWVARKLTRYR